MAFRCEEWRVRTSIGMAKVTVTLTSFLEIVQINGLMTAWLLRGVVLFSNVDATESQIASLALLYSRATIVGRFLTLVGGRGSLKPTPIDTSSYERRPSNKNSYDLKSTPIESLLEQQRRPLTANCILCNASAIMIPERVEGQWNKRTG